jgi:hypothetical protein
MAGWMRQIGAYPRSPLTALAEAGQGIDHVILSFPAGMTADRQDTDSRQLIAAVTDRLT